MVVYMIGLEFVTRPDKRKAAFEDRWRISKLAFQPESEKGGGDSKFTANTGDEPEVFQSLDRFADGAIVDHARLLLELG